MIESQMLLFNDAPERVTEAIKTLNDSTVLLPNYEDFVRQLGTKLTTLAPGTVILGAVPNAAAIDEVSALLRTHLNQAQACGFGMGGDALATLSVPLAVNVKAQQRALLATYNNGPRFSDVRRGTAEQLVLETELGPGPVSPFHVTAALVSHRASTSYYLLQNAHHLQRPGASLMEGAEQLRLIVRLAAESKRTQVLLGSYGVLFRWLSIPEIVESVSACVLKPYDMGDTGEEKIFRGLLNTYDKLLPWDGKAQLLANADNVHFAVSGCPFRLRKWLLDSLILAKARGLAGLSGKLLGDTGPLDAEQRAAWKDFQCVRKLRQPFQQSVPKPVESEGKKKRFPRSLKRPDVGFAAA
jgi:hypothetical protein